MAVVEALAGRAWAEIERAKAEAALRASEEKYRSLFESIDEGVSMFEVVFDENDRAVDLIFLDNNPAFTKMTGLQADVINKRTSVVVPNLERFWIETYEQVVKTGTAVRFEHESAAVGRWFDVHASWVGGRQVVLVYRDISARKRAEERQAFLLKLSDTLRAEQGADAVANRALRMLSEQLKLDRCYVGVYRPADDRADLTHQVGNDRVPPLPDRIRLSDFPDALRVAIDRTLVIDDVAVTAGLSDTDRRNIGALGLRALVAAGLRKGEGSLLWTIVAVSATPRGWTRDEVALVEEVTERTWAAVERAKAEAEREGTQRTLATLVERCPFGIYLIDADFRIASVNAGSQDRAFANVRPLIGRPFDEAMRVIWPEPVATECINIFRHTLDTGEPYFSRDFVSPRADTGQTEGYEWELHRITLPNGRYGVVCYYFDATRLRQAEQALREADRKKDEFLATLAHELRNPLAPIRNGLQLMKLAGNDEEAVEQARSMMERQLEQMVRLVDDLMDVSRITRGKVELRKQRLQLAAVVSSAVEACRPLIDQMGHELTVTLPKHPVVVDADLTRLAQVFANLLNNAAKYSDRGGRIWLTVEQQGSDAVVSVRDTGIGIPAANLTSIFDMFSQVDRSLEKSQGGLGIGLTLVKRLIEMHGGRIEAKSEGLGQGSEFVVWLPVVVEALATPIENVDDRAGSKSSLRILIVDDNKDAADSSGMLLTTMGNVTHLAYDGHEGIEVAERVRPEVILLDIGLPKLNGHETCRRPREQPWGKGIVLIAVTGWGQEEDRRRSHEAGFDHHMVKPVDPLALNKLLADQNAVKK